MTGTSRGFSSQMWALSALVSLAFSSVANAAAINHGDYAGDDVIYTDVTESSVTDPVPLYGSPITEGNDLVFFDPTATTPSGGFGASASNGSVDNTDGLLNFRLTADAGFGISSIAFNEGGDYALDALGAALAKVTAALSIFEVRVTHVDGAPITPFTLMSNPTPTVSYQLPGDPPVDFWSLADFFDLDQELDDRAIPFNLGVTELTVKVDNVLIAISQPGSIAQIIKKGFRIDIETKIPEPSAALLAGMGVIGAALAGRRRR